MERIQASEGHLHLLLGEHKQRLRHEKEEKAGHQEEKKARHRERERDRAIGLKCCQVETEGEDQFKEL